MQLTNSLLLAAVAGISSTAALQNADVVHVVVRELTTIALPLSSSAKRGVPHMFRRDAEECASAATQFTKNIDIAAVPTPDPQLISDLASYFQDHPDATSSCSLEFTGSLSSEYAVYTSSLSAWIGDHSSDLSAFIDACTDVPAIKSQVGQILGPCTDALSKLAGGSSGDATNTGSSASPSSTGSSSDSKDNAAPRFAGSVVGAAALAGVVAFAL